ncbi:DUF4367 domain-containing protein [Lentibacillus sp. CBA3610]|uniref:DUF4367 domain-containing protein n=1 Tax=Lentibacillus sp. CBA3610 TaxID=2518176 RepID=UPI001595B573|nr:DUF4367 domain-containing protein [Lentibacillus sp. CBA3610]QKY71043.1 DUF4367 domain-containing protein [Lentibacillus sp. CBA3610]
MKHHDDSYLNDLLKKMDDDVSWNNKRQQNVRRNVLSAIDQEGVKSSRRITHWFGKKIVPVLATLLLVGVSVPLIMSEAGDQQPLGQEQADEVTQAPGDSGNENGKGYYVDQQNGAYIEDIKASGFDLRLPGYSPGNHIEVGKIVKRASGSGSHVSVTFNQEDEEIFKFWQESFNSDDPARVDQRIEQIKTEASDQLSIGVHNAYIVNDKKGESLYIVTESYGFTIHSSELPKDQMIKVAESIDLSDLN